LITFIINGTNSGIDRSMMHLQVKA